VAGGPRTAALLDRLDKAVAWATLAKPIAALPEYRAPARGQLSKGGRPARPALTMLKCVLLAKWFGLSDPQPEECLQDRLSFRRFVGLSLTDATAPHDSNFIDELTAHETRVVVADGAYRSAEREAALEARGVCCAIAYKRQKGQKELPPLLRKINRMIASARAAVEHPFAWMRAMGYRRVRYRGRRRNEVDFVLRLIAYNWKRSLSLTKAG
jgi:IS5 family transposase